MKTEKEIKLIISQKRKNIKEISSMIKEMKQKNTKKHLEFLEEKWIIEDEISLLKWVLK